MIYPSPPYDGLSRLIFDSRIDVSHDYRTPFVLITCLYYSEEYFRNFYLGFEHKKLFTKITNANVNIKKPRCSNLEISYKKKISGYCRKYIRMSSFVFKYLHQNTQ
jgi:hypothetical protein